MSSAYASTYGSGGGGRDRDYDSRDRRDRDRDRGGRDRDRDRDRGRDRERRDRRSRSRDRGGGGREERDSSPYKRGPRRRRTWFDVMPDGTYLPPAGGEGAGDNVPEAIRQLASASAGAGAGGALPGALPGEAAGGASSQQATRHARRIYVGGLPPSSTETGIATFFSHALSAIGGNTAGPGEAVINVYINYEKKFAFVEFRTVEEASNAMALDGIMFEGVSVRVRRPNDYNAAAAAPLGPSLPNPALDLSAIGLSAPAAGGAPAVPGVGTDGVQTDRVFVGGLPYYLTVEQCKELLTAFGPIKTFDLVVDRETGNSKGYGFVVYEDPSVTDVACAGLNGLKMGERTLTVRRATDSSTATVAPTAAQQSESATAASAGSMATRIVVLNEAVTIDELKDDEEYGEIVEDMRDECAKYGILRNVIIPRPPPPGAPPPAGLGKVVIEFADANAALKARNAIHGRKFGGREVRAFFMEEAKYLAGDFDALCIGELPPGVAPPRLPPVNEFPPGHPNGPRLPPSIPPGMGAPGGAPMGMVPPPGAIALPGPPPGPLPGPPAM